MAARYERVQMLLEPGQRRSLVEIANRQGKSLSEVTRQAIDLGLDVLERENEFSGLQNFLIQAERLRESMPMLNVDPVEDLHQMREERDERLTGSSD